MKSSKPLNLSLRSNRVQRAMEGLRIRDEYGRIIPLKFSDSQRMLWDYIYPHLDDPEGRVWVIVLKGRQVYATTFFEALTFIRTVERPNTQSLVIAQELIAAHDIFNMAKRFYDHLPLPKMRPSKVTEIEFPFPDGTSRFRVVSAGTAAKGRGMTGSCVHCSEVAFWSRPEVLTGMMQAMPDLPDTIWVLESTANGMSGVGELFYNEWKAAVSGRSKLLPIFIPWFIMPKYRMQPAIPTSEWDEEEEILVREYSDFGLDGEALAWRRYAIQTKTQGMVSLFHQEYPSCPEEAFISTGLPAFDPLAILRQQHNIKPPVAEGTMDEKKFLKKAGGELKIWKHPDQGHQYVIGVDTSEGLKGGDYACAQVLDMRELEQVAVVHGLIQPWDLAELLNQLGYYYNKALIAVEIQVTGHVVQDRLIRQFAYPNLHPWKGKPDRVHRGMPKLWGWETNVYSRPLLISAGRQAINTGLLAIRDRATLDEIKHFTQSDTGKYEAEAGHDDRVIALLIALRSREENFVARTNIIIRPNISEPDSLGVRTIETFEDVSIKRIHRAMSQNAKSAVKNWMSL